MPHKLHHQFLIDIASRANEAPRNQDHADAQADCRKLLDHILCLNNEVSGLSGSLRAANREIGELRASSASTKAAMQDEIDRLRGRLARLEGRAANG